MLEMSSCCWGREEGGECVCVCGERIEESERGRGSAPGGLAKLLRAPLSLLSLSLTSSRHRRSRTAAASRLGSLAAMRSTLWSGGRPGWSVRGGQPGREKGESGGVSARKYLANRRGGPTSGRAPPRRRGPAHSIPLSLSFNWDHPRTDQPRPSTRPGCLRGSCPPRSCVLALRGERARETRKKKKSVQDWQTEGHWARAKPTTRPSVPATA